MEQYLEVARRKIDIGARMTVRIHMTVRIQMSQRRKGGPQSGLAVPEAAKQFIVRRKGLFASVGRNHRGDAAQFARSRHLADAGTDFTDELPLTRVATGKIAHCCRQ